jgi:DNA-binding transcriptional MerR regulator
MQIGELAKRVDLNPKTIRYYEEIGLLPVRVGRQVATANMARPPSRG